MSEGKKPSGGSESLYNKVAAAENLSDPKYDPFRRNDIPWSSPMEVLKVC